ncbi:MAG: HD domain-containing protein, partial [Lachnospiraceae bacterium]|nr:HD domain-containing protein [Lachnospiraceae bacterium]
KDYTAAFDVEDIMIDHKIYHTMRVAENAERIALSSGLDRSDADYAWLLGLLHDFGRFEQVKRYGTFSDIHSVDHAELGADILFKDGEIKRFIPAGFNPDDSTLTETAIRLHNKLLLPEDQDDRTRFFCNLLRDADKIDILRVVQEIPLKQRAGKGKDFLKKKNEASATVMEYVYSHRCIPRKYVESGFELHISHICMAFELVFEESRRIVAEQGFLDKLLSPVDENGEYLWNESERIQLKILENEVEKFLTDKDRG